MIGLIQVHFAQTTKKQWFFVFLILFLNALLSTTQLSWDFYMERYSYWNIVLNVTNNPIDIVYIFTFVSTLIIANPTTDNSWNQLVCVRCCSRRKYFVSILAAHGIKTVLFVMLIPLTCYLLSFIYPVSFQDDWGLITAAGSVPSHKPLDLVILSVSLLFFRFFSLGLAAKIMTIITRLRMSGIIIFLLLSFGSDTSCTLSNLQPGKWSMLNNTLVSANHHGNWNIINAQFAFVYWLIIIFILLGIGYAVIRKTDLSGKGV